MELIISFNENGTIQTLYNENIDLSDLGKAKIKRASHVEPNENGEWMVDLSPINGPMLGPFKKRSEALKEEHKYINNLLKTNVKL